MKTLLLLMLTLCCALPLLALTDDEEAEKSGATPPAEWIFPAQPPLRVLEVHGRWYPYYATDRALARLGGASMTISWHQPDSVRYYPESYEALMSQHLIIVGNINGEAFGPVRRAMLKRYVQEGGSILFLGGRLAFGKSYHGTALEEICPVTFADKYDVTAAPPGGLTLAPGPGTIGKGFAQLAWADKPSLFWYHDGLTVKPGATVLLTANGKPMLITGTYGKGRVALYAGTVLGDPQPGQRAFWEWKDWPDVLATTINWLTEPLRVADTKLSVEGRKELAIHLLGNQVEKATEIGPRFTRAASTCRDHETARLLLKAFDNLTGDIPMDLADAADDGVRPFADDACAPEVEALLVGEQSSKVSLGLRILGQIHGEGARKKLEEALTAEPNVGGPQDPLDGDAVKDAGVEDTKDAGYAIRVGALEGLGNLADPQALPALQNAIRKYGQVRSKPETYPLEVTQEDELYQEAVLSALRCGDATQAGPAIDLLLENRYVLIRMMSRLDAPLYPGPEHAIERIKRELIRKNLPRVWARQERQYHKLSALPAGVLPALAARLAIEDDPRAVPIAFAIFGKGFTKSNANLPQPVVDALRKAVLPAIADLAQP